MLLITKKSTVAMIGGHYVYQIEGTELVPLTPAEVQGRWPEHRGASFPWDPQQPGLDPLVLL